MPRTAAAPTNRTAKAAKAQDCTAKVDDCIVYFPVKDLHERKVKSADLYITATRRVISGQYVFSLWQGQGKANKFLAVYSDCLHLAAIEDCNEDDNYRLLVFHHRMDGNEEGKMMAWKVLKDLVDHQFKDYLKVIVDVRTSCRSSNKDILTTFILNSSTRSLCQH
jgi:hypothetical protein